MDTAEAKERLRIPELWQRLNLSGQPKTSCRSPFRNDRKPSFSVSRDGRLFYDFATGEGGDAIDFFARATGLPLSDACRDYVKLAFGRHSVGAFNERPRRLAPANQKLDLTGFHQGELHELHALARLRNVSVESLRIASNHDLILFGDVLGYPSWIITDSRRVMAQARRTDGEDFPTAGNLSQRKAHTLRGSVGGWPVGAVAIRRGDVVLLTEGGPDLLAACHFIWCEGREQDVVPVAMLGATQRIHEGALPYLVAARHIRLFPHIDSSGRLAASNWARQLRQAGAIRVDAFSFAGLSRSDGFPVKDLNDCTSVDYDCFEQERSLWGIIP